MTYIPITNNMVVICNLNHLVSQVFRISLLFSLILTFLPEAISYKYMARLVVRHLI